MEVKTEITTMDLGFMAQGLEGMEKNGNYSNGLYRDYYMNPLALGLNDFRGGSQGSQDSSVIGPA